MRLPDSFLVSKCLPHRVWGPYLDSLVLSLSPLKIEKAISAHMLLALCNLICSAVESVVSFIGFAKVAEVACFSTRRLLACALNTTWENWKRLNPWRWQCATRTTSLFWDQWECNAWCTRTGLPSFASYSSEWCCILLLDILLTLPLVHLYFFCFSV